MTDQAERWITAEQTHQGMRRKHNEDAILSRPEIGLWIVADGMGGHEAGDVASNMVIEALSAVSGDGSINDFVDRVDDTMIALNEQLRAHSAENFGGKTMGCTVVLMLARGELGVCLWAGDSRLYRLRDGVMTQVSRDHSPLEELIEQGVLTEEEAETHPDSSVITRAVGGQSQLFMDIALVDIKQGDTFLLCSDGLYREVKVAEIRDFLVESDDDVESSVEKMMACSLERGARDNVSIIVSRCVA